MTLRFSIPMLTGVCLMLAGSGCGGQVKLDLVPVTGAVTLDGKPLANARVQFSAQLPADGKSKAVVEDSNAVTDADGKYALRSIHRLTPGAMAGSYKVIISKLVSKDGKDIVPGGTEDQATLMGDAKEVLPRAYSSAEETTLTATVPAAGGTVNFELKSRP